MTKRTIAVISAACGGVMLATAAAANYSTANGYEVLKDSLLGLRGIENYTVDLKMGLECDGKSFVNVEHHLETADNGLVTYSESKTSALEGVEDYGNRNWYDGENMYWAYKYADGTEHFNGMKVESSGSNLLSKDAFSGDEETDAKIIRFMELAADTVVGDLKNNFTYTDGDDDYSTYTVSLDSIQIPELVNAGVSLMFSGIADSYDYDVNGEESDIYSVVKGFSEDAYTESVTGAFTVNSDGTFRDGSVSAVLAGRDENGEVHKMTLSMELAMSNVGTTNPQRISEEELEKVKMMQSYADKPAAEVTVETSEED